MTERLKYQKRLEHRSIDLLGMTIKDAIVLLQNKLEQYPDAYFGNGREGLFDAKTAYHCFDDSEDYGLYLCATRPETEKEWKFRLKQEQALRDNDAKRQKFDEEQEYQRYLVLKNKWENK